MPLYKVIMNPFMLTLFVELKHVYMRKQKPYKTYKDDLYVPCPFNYKNKMFL
jgi:hypothetical protein